MKKLLFAFVLLLSSTACLTMNAELPGTLRSDLDSKDYRVVGKYQDTVEHTYYFWGLANKPKADIFAPAMQKEVARVGGDGLANIEYSSEIGCLQEAIGCGTCGIIAPWTYHISGDIVVIQKPALPGARPVQAAAAPSSADSSAATTTPDSAKPLPAMGY